MSAIIPQYEFIGSGDAPESLADFEGMRVRALGGLGRAMAEIGATPTPVPASEIYTALDRGTIDATGFSHASMLPFRFHEVSDWYTVDMNPGTLNCPMVINTDAFDALPEQYQDLLMEAKDVGYKALKEANRTGTEKALDVFEQELVTVRFSDEEMATFRETAGRPIWEDWIEENQAAGLPAKELFDLVMETASSAN
jgi:TRAP-type C4-dicarboxylate transport system substrate-binding protein